MPALCPECGAPLPPDGVCAGCVARAADAAPQATTRQSPSSVLERPDRIGVYKILDTLGEGGMGTSTWRSRRDRSGGGWPSRSSKSGWTRGR